MALRKFARNGVLALAATALLVVPTSMASAEIVESTIDYGDVVGPYTDTEVLFGWHKPTSSGFTIDVLDETQLLIRNGLEGSSDNRFFSHASLGAPALTTTVGEPRSGADESEIEVSFTIASGTDAYQEGLSLALALDTTPKGSDRSGGTVYFVHKDDAFFIGSFWYDPTADENAANPPVAPGPYSGAALHWTEVVSVALSPSESYEVTVHGKYVDGLGEGHALNDEVTITIRDESGSVVDTLHAGSWEGRGVANEGENPEAEAASAKVLSGLTFYSGRNTVSAKRVGGGEVFYPNQAASATDTTGFVLGPISVRTGSTPEPEPEPTPSPGPTTDPEPTPEPTLPGTGEEPEPTTTPTIPADASALRTATPLITISDIGSISASAWTTIDLGVAWARQWVYAVFYSEPTVVGWIQADAAGRVSVQVPATLSEGSHTLALFEESGTLIASADLQLGAEGEDDTGLPDTGMSAHFLVASLTVVSLLLMTGAALFVLGKRRHQMLS